MNKTNLIIAGAAILLVVLVILGMYIPNNNDNLVNIVVEEYNDESSIYSSDKESSITGGFESVKKVGTGNFTFVVHNFNPINPVVHFIQESNAPQSARIDSSLLQRRNINEYEVIDYKTFEVKNYEFDDLVRIAESNNIYYQNPDPINIRVQETSPRAPIDNEIEFNINDIDSYSPDSYLLIRIKNLPENEANEVMKLYDFCFNEKKENQQLYPCLLDAKEEVEEKYPLEKYPVTDFN